MKGGVGKPLLALATLLITVVLVSPARAQFYQQKNLVSDIPGMAALTDSQLVNPWGGVSQPHQPILGV